MIMLHASVFVLYVSAFAIGYVIGVLWGKYIRK